MTTGNEGGDDFCGNKSEVHTQPALYVADTYISMKTNKAQIVLSLSVGGCLLGCMGNETPDSIAFSAAFEVSDIEVRDWSGRPMPEDAIARRPKIALKISEKADGSDRPALLISGRADELLREDLRQSPLRTAHRDRVVPCDTEYRDKEIVLVPILPLDSGASYTVAVAGWARSTGGKRLNRDGSPFIAELAVSSGADVGAQAVDSWPADGTVAVAPNLDFAAIAFDGEVRGVEQAIWLEDQGGMAVPAAVRGRPCEQIGWHGKKCVVIVPDSSLTANATYLLVVGSQVRDGRGAPVGDWSAEFSTAGEKDLSPARWQPRRCATDEQETPVGCALIDDRSVTLRVQTEEPARVQVVAGQQRDCAVLLRDEAMVALGGLKPDEPLAVEVQTVDFAANRSTSRFSLRTRCALPTLSITEVRADPRGPEPNQEFIELLNWGETAVDLEGFAISDDPYKLGQTIDHSVLVHPGGRVLLVSDSFDPDSALDDAPASGTTLVRVGSALTGDGLSNSGKAIFLRDQNGSRVTGAPATPKPEPGRCMVRVVDDPRDGTVGAFAYDPNGDCTPGR